MLPRGACLAHRHHYAPGVEDHLPQSVRVERRPVSERESRSANGPDWDRYADEYQSTHGDFLGDIGFLWGPEGLTEVAAHDKERGEAAPVTRYRNRSYLAESTGMKCCGAHSGDAHRAEHYQVMV